MCVFLLRLVLGLWIGCFWIGLFGYAGRLRCRFRPFNKLTRVVPVLGHHVGVRLEDLIADILKLLDAGNPLVGVALCDSLRLACQIGVVHPAVLLHPALQDGVLTALRGLRSRFRFLLVLLGNLPVNLVFLLPDLVVGFGVARRSRV